MNCALVWADSFAGTIDRTGVDCWSEWRLRRTNQGMADRAGHGRAEQEKVGLQEVSWVIGRGRRKWEKLKGKRSYRESFL